MQVHADEEDTLWYYFMVGHEVPLTFLDLPVFPGLLSVVPVPRLASTESLPPSPELGERL